MTLYVLFKEITHTKAFCPSDSSTRPQVDLNAKSFIFKLPLKLDSNKLDKKKFEERVFCVSISKDNVTNVANRLELDRVSKND
jgi:hypothetical protein